MKTQIIIVELESDASHERLRDHVERSLLDVTHTKPSDLVPLVLRQTQVLTIDQTKNVASDDLIEWREEFEQWKALNPEGGELVKKLTRFEALVDRLLDGVSDDVEKEIAIGDLRAFRDEARERDA